MTEHAGCRVLVADTAPTRLGVRMALEGMAIVCAEAGNLAEAVSAALREQPDVCLVGQLLPGGGIEAVRRLSGAVPDAAVVLLACSDSADDLVAALRAGALGYVPADVNAARLRRVVRAVHAQQASVPQSMVRDLVDELRAPGAGDARLTARQTQILRMLRRGDSTAGIATHLAISPVTVRRHISTLVEKIGANDRGGLISAERGSRR